MMESIKTFFKYQNILNNNFFISSILTLILISSYYINNSFILYGEGNFLNFKVLLQKEASSWSSTNFLGQLNTSNGSFNIIFFLLSFLKFKISNFLFFFLIFFFIFYFKLIILDTFKVKNLFFKIVFVLFFSFSFNFLILLQSGNFYIFSIYILYLFTSWLLYKHHNDLKKIFYYFGSFHLIFSFSLLNQPMFGSYIIYCFFYSIFIKIYFNLSFKKLSAIIFTCLISFLIFNSYWFLTNILSILDLMNNQNIVNSNSYIRWLITNSADNNIFSGFSKNFMNFGLLNIYGDNYFIERISRFHILSFLKYFSFILFAYYLINALKMKLNNKINLFLIITLFIISIIASGFNFFSLFFNSVLFEYIPLFSIFRNGTEKFSIFISMIYFMFFLINYEKNKNLFIKIFTLIYVLIISIIIYFSSGIFFDSNHQGKNISRNFNDIDSIIQIKNTLDQSLRYTVLDAIGKQNHNILIFNNKNSYTGQDYLINNTSHSYLFYNQNTIDFYNLYKSNLLSSHDLSDLGIKYIYLNKNIDLSFSGSFLTINEFLELDLLNEFKLIYNNDGVLLFENVLCSKNMIFINEYDC